LRCAAEFYDERDTFYIVLEIITGGELFDRIVEKEKYTEREAREVILQMTSAIAYAHERGVAHRDLKPENILLRDRTDDTSIKIADLGFAKVLTREGQLMTTPCG
jgi:serine/threonine protein kinase